LKSLLDKKELAHSVRAHTLSKQQDEMKNHCASMIQSYEEKTAQLKENRQNLILKHQAILEELEVSSYFAVATLHTIVHVSQQANFTLIFF
jgi:hypothetical protein